jgi:hypothetical protein
MILPWLQIDQEAFERGVELAALLNIDEAQAVGHLVMLWRWALSRPADSTLSGIVMGATAVAQIEAGARWRGPRGALVEVLRELGLVEVEGPQHRIRGLERYRAQLEKRAQDRERKRSPESSAGIPTEVQRTALGKSGQTQMQMQTQKEQQLPLSAELPADRAVVVFEHWRKVMGKNARTAFDARRRKAVEARLADGYTVEDLCRAIEGCARTPHNAGQNDRGERFDDLELICRDASHVDRFRANAEAAGPPAQRRPDHDALVEALEIAKAVGDPQLPKMLAQLRWERHQHRLSGTGDDPYELAYLARTYGVALGERASERGIDMVIVGTPAERAVEVAA